MEIVIVLALTFTVAAILIAISVGRKKRREATLKEHAEDQKNPMTAGLAAPVWTRNEATNYPYRKRYSENVPTTPAPVQQDNTGSMLLAGVVGYALASSNSAHAAPIERQPRFDAGGGDSGGAGASADFGSCEPERSSSYDSGSSSDSGSSYSSSDSGSSYSSSDSGSSGGGSSD